MNNDQWIMNNEWWIISNEWWIMNDEYPCLKEWTIESIYWKLPRLNNCEF